MLSGINLGLYASKTVQFSPFQIGINPGLMAAYIGRWFPGPGNHFCKLCDKNGSCLIVKKKKAPVLVLQK